VFGAEFSKLYRNARAGICFFSKINNDLWTRRPLEIIASGGLLVCERTTEAVEHFLDGEEAYFFSSFEELVEVMKFIRDNPMQAMKVRQRGREKLLAGRYSLSDRVEEMLRQIKVRINS
jgi:spore maturation protein CgeB